MLQDQSIFNAQTNLIFKIKYNWMEEVGMFLVRSITARLL